MPLAGTALPFGLRDIRLTPVAFDGSAPGTAVDLPNARTFSFEETEDYEVLRGDDTEVASRGSGPTVKWEIESGGISLDAYAVMAGGTVAVTGSTPNQIRRYIKLSTDTRPSFRVEGLALSESGGDLHGIVYVCKADESLSGEFGDGAFWLTSASGTGRRRVSDNRLYDFVQNETVTLTAQAV